MENLDIEPGDSLHETLRGTINLTSTPIPQLDVVIEFLTGRRVNKDGAQGTSSQIPAGWTFRFCIVGGGTLPSGPSSHVRRPEL